MQIICVNSCFLCLFVCVSCAFLSHICIPSVSSIVFCSRSFCIFFSYTRLGVCVPAKTFFCGWGTQKHEWGAPRFLRNSIRHKNTLSAWLRQSAFSLHPTPYHTPYHTPFPPPRSDELDIKPKDYPIITEGLPKDKTPICTIRGFYYIYTMYIYTFCRSSIV